MTDIIIADDHEIIRNGLANLIGREEGLQVVAEAASYVETAELLENCSCDLLILDLNLGDTNGLESISRILECHPDIKILVLSMYSEELYARQAFMAGAYGYLNKAVISSELLRAIREISRGEKYISVTLAENLPYGTSLEKSEQAHPIESLSKREFEIFSLIAAGKTPKEIAFELDLSPKTVSTYQSRIQSKLHLSNTAQLARYAFEYASTR